MFWKQNLSEQFWWNHVRSQLHFLHILRISSVHAGNSPEFVGFDMLFWLIQSSLCLFNAIGIARFFHFGGGIPSTAISCSRPSVSCLNVQFVDCLEAKFTIFPRFDQPLIMFLLGSHQIRFIWSMLRSNFCFFMFHMFLQSLGFSREVAALQSSAGCRGPCAWATWSWGLRPWGNWSLGNSFSIHCHWDLMSIECGF